MNIIAINSQDPIIAWRERRSLPRKDFCMALFVAGVLPKGEVIAAARGDWPATFNAALVGLSEFVKVAAEVEWATAASIRRNHPLINDLRLVANMTDAQIDSLFGWVAP